MDIDASEQIEKFKEFFDSNYIDKLHELSKTGKVSLSVDFSQLNRNDPGLADQLLDEPDETLKAAEVSLEQFDIENVENIKIRFYNLPDSQRLRVRDIRSEHLGRFIFVEGVVKQATDVRPQVTSAKFECPVCGNTISILQIDIKFKEPSRCSCGKRGRFRLIGKELIDAQKLVVEESPEFLIGGEQPKRLNIFLRGDLVEPVMEKKTTPGSKIRVVGIISEIPVLLKTGVPSTRYDLIMESNFIEPLEETFDDVQLSKKDIKEIIKLARDPKVYSKLVNSIAPSIYGHENIKEALVLQLIGGVKKERKDGTSTRGDMHVLLVGDPGAAKSSLLMYMSKAAPKARYVAGRGVSAAGLTASVVKDEFLRGWALEAGALVLANNGFCMIDEMDKISVEDTGALHEAMAQQQISISKANIQACYSFDTEVLTDKGWKKYLEVKNAKLAQYDPSKKTIEFLPHNGLFIYNYNKKMYHFKSKRNDIFVTPNHKMLAKEYKQKDYKIFEADKLKYNLINFLNSGNFIGQEQEYFILPPIQHKQNRKHPKYTHQYNPKKIPMGLWLEFLGYYVTEGGIERRNKNKNPGVALVQKKGLNAKKIKNCLLKMSKYVGFTLTEIKDDSYIRFKITNMQLSTFLDNQCGKICYERKFPVELLSLSKKQLKIFYDTMMLGDGSSDGKSFSSTSLELIDLFQAVACLIGKSASKNIQYKEGHRGNRKTMYRVCLSDKIEPSIKKKDIKRRKYKGKVFCFSTKTGFFITRRNGKIAIQGNTLKCQTTILAAANPKLGRFDPYQPIASQINMPPALVNRFDLIFPVRDLPNEKMDTKIATHVLEVQQKEGGIDPEIEIPLLKKYISYVRAHIKPKLTESAIDEIKNFYVKLRNTGSSGDDAVKPIPISARQLESLVRLSEASAKIRLSKKVTRLDARKAITILQACLQAVGFDYETGQYDIDRISTGIPTSQRNKFIVIREIIDKFDKEGKKAIPIEDILAEAVEKNVNEAQVEEIITKMKKEGSLYEPKRGFLSKV